MTALLSNKRLQEMREERLARINRQDHLRREIRRLIDKTVRAESARDASEEGSEDYLHYQSLAMRFQAQASNLISREG